MDDDSGELAEKSVDVVVRLEPVTVSAWPLTNV